MRADRRAATLWIGRGFTLIELLLVLVILAVLATLVVGRYTGVTAKGKITTAQTQISYLGVALSRFEIDCGRYPTTEEGLGALVTQPANANGWSQNGYLEKGVPNDPWGNPYVYRCPGQHNVNGYDLYSFGPNGQDGGDDDIDNWSTK